MWRVFEQVVFRVRLARSNGVDLAADRDHRVAETVELMFRFALGRLDHHRARDRPGNGRRVKAVIHQTLGHVFHFDAGALAGAQVEDAFVRDEIVFAFEEDREMQVEPFRDVVGVQDSDLGRFR